MAKTYYLEAVYDARQSFYGKAIVKELGNKKNTKQLLSYLTHVATIEQDKNGNRRAIVLGLHSNTTLRHIKEFLRQEGFRADNKAQIEQEYMA